MEKILFLAHRIPFPPDRGDKIRAHNVLRHFARSCDVWLGAGVDDHRDLARRDEAQALCRDVFLARLTPARRALNMAAGALAGAPLSVSRFGSPGLGRWVRRVLREERPDVVYVSSSALARYVVGRTSPGTRLIVDFVDVDAEKWRAYAEGARAPMRWIYGAEFRRLVRFERRVLGAAEAGILVSETERRLLSGFAPEGAGKLRVISNGVDIDGFRPIAGGEGAAGPIVFCGRMDYPPNVEGARWLVQEVLPRVRERRPEAGVRIVGAAPAASVLALARIPGVEVTGAVADVRPHLAQAAVIVVPLRIARGVQNKLLEAMACGRPVVTTPQGLDGVAAEPGRDLLVAEGAPAFAEAVVRVLDGHAPPDLGARGREFVERRHRWSTQLAELDRLIAAPVGVRPGCGSTGATAGSPPAAAAAATPG